MALDLFKELLPSILQTKKDILEVEKDYPAYTVNKALSFHADCLMYANEMNRYPNLDRRLQYHYLINTLRAYKRPFQKWQKLQQSDDLDLVKEYYNYSNEKAKVALEVLSRDQLDTIKKNLDKGGIHDKSKRSNRSDSSRE